MRSTPVLLVVFLIVFARWLELFTGWSEALVLPAVGLAGTVLIDRMLLPADARLTARSWALNLLLAIGVGVLVGVALR